MSPRPLDHLVMPVTDIRVARERLTALGFTVAADARHPFGTENACVFFGDKTYLEPLGVANEEECRASAAAGNQFTARNADFRHRNGAEGLSAIVMGSEDAEGDHARFIEAGISGGEILQFSRIMKMPDGSEIAPTFKLAFAADSRSPEFHAITCQRINVPPADRSALEKHANGVVGIASVVLTEVTPAELSGWLQAVVGEQAMSSSDGEASFASANAAIRVVNAAGAHDFPEVEVSEQRGLRGALVIFKVTDLTATETLLASNAISFNKHNGLLIVLHQPGQAVPFAFSE